MESLASSQVEKAASNGTVNSTIVKGGSSHSNGGMGTIDYESTKTTETGTLATEKDDLESSVSRNDSKRGNLDTSNNETRTIENASKSDSSQDMLEQEASWNDIDTTHHLKNVNASFDDTAKTGETEHIKEQTIDMEAGDTPLQQDVPSPSPPERRRFSPTQSERIYNSTPQVLEEPPVLNSELTKMIDSVIKSLVNTKSKNHGVVSGHPKLKVSLSSILTICKLTAQMLLSEPPLLELDAPMNIVGDLHGQYIDLLKLLELGKHPPHSRYLFLGDYVDRGDMGIECCLLLFCYKLKYPNHVFMLRGNHECQSISRVYGFHEECKQRFSLRCWRAFNSVFEVLPFAAVVGECIFCTHGGLSPSLFSLDQIRCIHRPVAIPDRGLLCDLVWSDPCESVETESGWVASDRGVSFLFDESVVESFLEDNGFELFVRAHQVVENGYEFFPHDRRLLVTVFSAPNYCGQFDNAGAMMIVDKDLVTSFLVICPDEHRERVSSSVSEMEESSRSLSSSVISNQ